MRLTATVLPALLFLKLSLSAPVSPPPTVLTLQTAADFVSREGFPLSTGYSAGASITAEAPFGVAIRSGSPNESTVAAVAVSLSPGVTVQSIAFSYRQCTGFSSSEPGPNFTLSIAGTAAFESGPLGGYPYKRACPGGECYSPAANVSVSSLAIPVPDDGMVHRIAFEMDNTGANLQLLLPMSFTVTCSGGPCFAPPSPPPAPNASAVNIACVGDSITEGYLSTNGADYPRLLQSMLGADYKVSNFGASGRTMLKKADEPYWTTGPLKQVLASKPGIVLLMLGTNDAKFHNWGPLHGSFPTDYKAMIDQFSALIPKPIIYLMTPPPLYRNDAYGMNQTVINSVFPGDGPAGVRMLAKSSGLPAPIDLFSLWQEHCPVVGGTAGHAPNNTDVTCDWIAKGGTDACHPSNDGYGHLAAAIKARIVG